MKIHLHLVQEITFALQEIFGDEKYADKVIEQYFKKNKKWGARDRRFFAEGVYDITRWWRKYWETIGFEENLSEEQLIWIWALYWESQGNAIPPWEELQDRPTKKFELKSRASIESIPDWIDELGVAELGEKWPEILNKLNKKALVYLRANQLKTNREDLMHLLLKAEIKTKAVPTNEVGIVLAERKNVFTLEEFHKGLFEVQDVSSQLVAPLLNPQPGERVIDACAGAGGKTLHLGSMMKNKGKIIAMDIHEWKLTELKKRVARAGIDIVEARVIDSTKVIKRLVNTADALLLDVPCSGLGVLRRNPDAKWKLTPKRLDELRDLQRELINDYSAMVKKGGRMVYATCSILPSENEKQVEWFLAQEKNNDWKLVKDHKVSPNDYDGDGFYAALLERN